MINLETQLSSTILTKAFKYFQKNPLTNIGCTVGLVNNDDIYNWKCTLVGPNDSPYKGGYFKIIIKFPITFPINPPEVIFKTPIYHLNINPVQTENEKLGHCCISTLKNWSPDTSIEDILVSIFALFYAINPNSAYNGYGLNNIDEFIRDRNSYDIKAKYFTLKYANGKYNNQQNDKWDFSIN